MTRSLLAIASLCIAAALALSCSDDNGGSPPPAVKKAKISGVSQKGPFVEGTKATVYELDENFAQTSRSFFERIANNRGEFEIENIELASPYALLEADGQYRNEVTGRVTAAPIKLFAIADLREKDNVNVNIFTHLEYYRVLNLVKNGGKTVAEAKKQAQKEILAVFGIDNEGFKDSEDMTIFGTTESDAALLAVSILLQGDLNEGEFSQRLAQFSASLGETGKWDDAMTVEVIYTPYGDIKNAILSWELSESVPDFRKYTTNFVCYQSIGACDASREGETPDEYKGDYVYTICKNNLWQTLGPKCEEEGEKVYMDFDHSHFYYECENNVWKFHE
jgi:hypothetical protein